MSTTFTLPAASDQVFEQCPVGLHVLRLKEMERGIQGSPEFGGGERVKWVFTLERTIDATPNAPSKDNPDPRELEDWVGEDIWSFTSLSMGKKSKMREYAQALLNREIAEGEQLNASELIGKRAKVTIGRNDNGKAKFTSILPYVPASRAKPKPVAEPEPEPVEDEQAEAYDAGQPAEGDPF